MSGPTVHPLHPLDQVASRIYVAEYLCFPASSAPDPGALQAGLEKLLAIAPFLARQVCFAPPERASTASWIEVAGATYDAADLFDEAVDDAFDYDDWKARHFALGDCKQELQPVSLFAVFPTPVMRVKFTRVRGGVVLVPAIYHGVVDGIGFSRILRAWASLANRGTAQISREWSPEPGGPGVLEAHPSLTLDPPPAHPNAPIEFSCFHFSADTLRLLKELATKSLRPGEWISTTDALSALIWLRVCCVRVPDVSSDDSSMLVLSVNARERFDPPAPPGYVGNAVIHPATTILIHDAASLDLGAVALQIRRAINSVDDTYGRSLVKLAPTVPDVAQLKDANQRRYTHDLGLTSWAQQQLSSIDWANGIFSERTRVQRPALAGLGLMLPPSAEGVSGGQEVILGLTKIQMDRLMNDAVFSRYAMRTSFYIEA